MAQAVHEIENAAVLLVPAILGFVERNLHGLLNEVLPSEAFAQVHDEPHGLDGMAGVELPTLEAVN